MHNSGIQDILAYVQKPSRYLGTEINRIRKADSGVELRMALAFPDLYEIGTSHFGIQILYHILNQRPEIAAERVFAPDLDMEELLRRKNLPLCTLESRRPLADFDIIGFSLLYELNYTNVLNMLDMAGLRLKAADRLAAQPLVIAGGPCVCNPEPMAEFFDAMVLGDGERVILQMADIWLGWRKSGGSDKHQLLRQWSRLEGVYVPGFFTSNYDSDGFQHLEPKFPDHSRIQRAIVSDLDQAPFPDQPVVPFGRPVHDRLRLEISRGCSRGCRFCQAGMIYRPVRERSPRKLLELARRALDASGYEDLALLSLSTGDYTCLVPLMETLMQHCAGERVAVSLPSIRADTLSPKLMEQIKKVRKTGFTIAPEAGSQRLRDIINKNITFDDVARTVQDAFALGWQVIKLYFLIGLPFESEEDLDAISATVRELKKIKGPRRRRGQINVSLTTFIPKPHTPFQWASQIPLEQSMARLERLKAQLKIRGVQVKWQHPQMSILEGVLARGDRRLAPVMEEALRLGCRFDGWSEQFDFTRWEAAFEKCGLDVSFFTSRRRHLEEPLPWDHVDVGVTRDFLKAQWQDAQDGQRLSDCRHGACHQCGVCDFKEIQPRTFQDFSTPVPARDLDLTVEQCGPQVELTYNIRDQARFFGHLERANIFARALRRAGIAVQYSQGFHPMPRLSFDNPLPVGMESEAEKMRITVGPGVGCNQIVEGLNRHLPQGLQVVDCGMAATGERTAHAVADSYQIKLLHAEIDGRMINKFMQSDQWPYERQKSKGRSEVFDLKACIQTMRIENAATLYLVIRRLHQHTIRPTDVLRSVFQFDAEALKSIRVLKLARMPDGM